MAAFHVKLAIASAHLQRTPTMLISGPFCAVFRLQNHSTVLQGSGQRASEHTLTSRSRIAANQIRTKARSIFRLIASTRQVSRQHKTQRRFSADKCSAMKAYRERDSRNESSGFPEIGRWNSLSIFRVEFFAATKSKPAVPRD